MNREQIQEMINDMRNIVKPYIAKQLKKINYEGCGSTDKAEFETEFEVVLTLAEQALTILSAEPSDEQVKEYCRRRDLVLVEGEFMAHIIKGTPQAYTYKGMTNEEVIKTVFPKAVLHTECDDMYLSFQQGVYLQDKDTTWLNAPYRVEPEDQNNG